MELIIKVKCEFCGDSFEPKRSWGKFCSDKCRNNFHNDKKLIAQGDIPPPVICPHCTGTNQIEKLSYKRDNHYLCNTCAKEFISEP